LQYRGSQFRLFPFIIEVTRWAEINKTLEEHNNTIAQRIKFFAAKQIITIKEDLNQRKALEYDLITRRILNKMQRKWIIYRKTTHNPITSVSR
jgi:hypothetical protein